MWFVANEEAMHSLSVRAFESDLDIQYQKIMLFEG